MRPLSIHERTGYQAKGEQNHKYRLAVFIKKYTNIIAQTALFLTQ